MADNLSSTTLVGQGAGKYPTANSVVSDIMSIIQGNDLQSFPLNNEVLTLQYDLVSKFYVRIIIKEDIGIIKKLGEMFEKYNISIDSIQQIPITDINRVPFVITTNETNIKNLKICCNSLENLNENSFCLEPIFIMPIFNE